MDAYFEWKSLQMPRAAIFTEVMSVLEQRIQRGDYLLNDLPGERTLATETGVSHMTARKAVQALISKNVLVRATNGTLRVNPQYHARKRVAQVVMLYPAYPSPFLTQLRQNILRATQKYGFDLRPVQYVHWDEPVVMEALNHGGGTFIIPSSTDVPNRVLDAMRSNRCVSLDIDLSEHGVKSIRLFPDAHIVSVLDHFRRSGHTSVDCISSHTRNAEIQRRIDLWEGWLGETGLDGRLIEDATPSFEDPTPWAYRSMKRELEAGYPIGSALVGTTFPAAMGAIRACAERGYIAGRDVSISAVNIESPARFTTPSVAGLDLPNVASILQGCFDWLANVRPWAGRDLLEPERKNYFAGESVMAHASAKSVAL